MLQVIQWIVKFAAGVAIVIALLVLVAGRENFLEIIFGPMNKDTVDFKTLKLSPKPNQFLVCPVSYCAATAHMASPVFAGTTDALKRRWMAMVKTQPRVVLGAADGGAMQYDFIQRTEVVRYPDSITVRFIPLSNDKATLAIYSRSHYGQGDFGVNEARIRAWLAALADY